MLVTSSFCNALLLWRLLPFADDSSEEASLNLGAELSKPPLLSVPPPPAAAYPTQVSEYAPTCEEWRCGVARVPAAAGVSTGVEWLATAGRCSSS